MFNLVKKIKEKFCKKMKTGFTLVELLAVIVILAVIMIIAIPNVLNSMDVAKRKEFIEYIDRTASVAQQQYAQEQIEATRPASECYIYNIKTDIGLANTGDFIGWILINPSENDMYVTLYNNDFAIVNYHYSDGSLDVMDYLLRRSQADESRLTVNELCNASTCKSCSLKDETINNTSKKATLIDGPTINNKMIQLAGYSFNIKEVKYTNVIEDRSTVISKSDSAAPVYLWYKDNVIYFGSESDKIYLNQNCINLFRGLFEVVSIDLSHFYTDEVEAMSYMFNNDRKLTSLDVSHFNTSKVEVMNGMFGAVGLTTLNLSNFNTSSVYNMNQMFAASQFTSLDLSSFDTKGVEDMSMMFQNCPNLETVDLSSFTLGVTDVQFMFTNDTNLKTIYVSNKWDNSKIRRKDMVFTGCTSLSGYDASKVDGTYLKVNGGYLTLK